jgi:hypothetical protein
MNISNFFLLAKTTYNLKGATNLLLLGAPASVCCDAASACSVAASFLAADLVLGVLGVVASIGAAPSAGSSSVVFFFFLAGFWVATLVVSPAGSS